MTALHDIVVALKDIKSAVEETTVHLAALNKTLAEPGHDLVNLAKKLRRHMEP
jgi:hypothetical protein